MVCFLIETLAVAQTIAAIAAQSEAGAVSETAIAADQTLSAVAEAVRGDGGGDDSWGGHGVGLGVDGGGDGHRGGNGGRVAVAGDQGGGGVAVAAICGHGRGDGQEGSEDDLRE